MTFKFDGVDVSSVNLGGVPVTEVQLDGVSVWTSSSFVLSDHFSTTLYTGNDATQDIVSDLDFVANDGLVWIKRRTFSGNHYLVDTKRGVSSNLSSNLTNAETASPTVINAFNTDGFTLGVSNEANQSGQDQVAWQFIKAQGFMDIVEYVGDDIAGRTVAIDLDDGTAVFGMAIVKNLSASAIWVVQHRSLGGSQFLRLNDTVAAAAADASIWGLTDATATTLTIGTDSSVNTLSSGYISYNFAHNPSKGIFCGSYTGTGAAGNKIVTGFPVGWVMIKNTSTAANWVIFDIPRGMEVDDNVLYPNSSDAEVTLAGYIDSEIDGFEVSSGSNLINASGDNYIFMAIADPSQF